MPTRREEIEGILRQDKRTAQELATQFRVSLAEIIDDLEHIRISCRHGFKVIPSQCTDCGFTFSDREKLKTPSRCPRCKGERIKGAQFTII